MQRREQEHQQDAVGQHRRREPEGASRQRDAGAGQEQRQNVQDELAEPPEIGARREIEERASFRSARRRGRVDRILSLPHGPQL